MDARTQVEYDRIKAGPHEGEFSFLHHAGPVVEKSYDVMERVDCIVTEKAQKETPEQIYTRLRHIYWIDTLALLPECQEAYAKWQEADATFVIALLPNCGWDGKTIFGGNAGV